MSEQTLSEFKILTDESDTTYHYIMANNATEACKLFNEGEDNSPSIKYVSRTRTGITVNVPEADVKFIASVSDSVAEADGCAVYPVTHTVAEGQKVIFTAIPSDGYTFSEWKRGDTSLGTDETLEYAVTALEDDELYADIQAVFTHD